MAKLELKRMEKLEDRTLGCMVVYLNENILENELNVFNTLELPYKGNQRNISCIPCGKYKVTKRFSEKYGNHFKVESVPNRSDILIHVGNYPEDTHGCILIGDDARDINADGKNEVVNSKHAMRKLNKLLKNEKNIELVIID